MVWYFLNTFANYTYHKFYVYDKLFDFFDLRCV